MWLVKHLEEVREEISVAWLILIDQDAFAILVDYDGV